MNGPTSTILMREVTPADVPALLQLYASAGITGTRAFTVEQATQHLEKLARYPFYRVYVATLEERVVGTYELLLMDNMAKAGAKSAVVEDVAVDPEVQKRGIGRTMMAHARAVAKAHGAYKLALSSNLRRTQAHAFYESLGFTQHGVSFLVEP